MSDRSATLADLAALENVELDIGASSKAGCSRAKLVALRAGQARRIDFVDDAALPHQALGPYQWTPNPAGDLDRAN